MNSTDLGKLLKLTRQQKGLTQEQLAEILSVTTSAISKWENGKNLPDTDMLLKIALTLDLSIEDLYHPDQTIIHIQEGSPSNIGSSLTCSVEAPLKTTIKKHPPKYLTFGICLLLILLILGGIKLYTYYSAQKELNITQVAFRTIEDDVCGTVYEVACVYTGDLENTTITTPYFNIMRETWANNDFVSRDIIYMKASFYKNRESAINWDIPEKSIYIVR